MVLNLVIRMVVPMRREFGRSLDVQQFMRDDAYARTVLEQAIGSQDLRLREYAEQVQRHLYGARSSATPTAAAAAVVAAATAPPVPAPAADPTEAELRAKMLRRYTGGLR